MNGHGVILYGPPASGKDTVTRALHELDGRYRLVRRLKVGGGRRDGYRATTLEDVRARRARGLVLYENERYGNRYVIDRPELDRIVGAQLLPVVHLGQLDGVAAVTRYPLNWLTVLLWCSRQTAHRRLRERSSPNHDERLRAWDETQAELEAVADKPFALSLPTDDCHPAEAAHVIHARVSAQTPGWTSGERTDSR